MCVLCVFCVNPRVVENDESSICSFYIIKSYDVCHTYNQVVFCYLCVIVCDFFRDYGFFLLILLIIFGSMVGLSVYILPSCIYAFACVWLLFDELNYYL